MKNLKLAHTQNGEHKKSLQSKILNHRKRSTIGLPSRQGDEPWSELGNQYETTGKTCPFEALMHP